MPPIQNIIQLEQQQDSGALPSATPASILCCSGRVAKMAPAPVTMETQPHPRAGSEQDRE